jgi:hypothetical protein
LSAIAFLKTRALGGSHVLQFTAKLLHSTAAERDIEGSAEDNHEPVRSFAQHGDQSIRLGGDRGAETLPRAVEIGSNIADEALVGGAASPLGIATVLQDGLQ